MDVALFPVSLSSYRQKERRELFKKKKNLSEKKKKKKTACPQTLSRHS